MAGKIEYKKKSIVSTRQLYRRIAVGIRDTWKEIQQQKQVSQKIQTNHKKIYKYSIDDTDIDNLNENNIEIKNSITQNISADVNFKHNFINDPTNINETYNCVSQDFSNENNRPFNNLVYKFFIEDTPFHLSQDSVEENLFF